MAYYDAPYKGLPLKIVVRLFRLKKRCCSPLRKIILFLTLPCVLSLVLVTKSQAQFLKVAGTRMTNGTDSDFIIRSVGLGGYMLQEGYMFHLGFLGTETKIREKIRQMVGNADTKQFYKEWHRKFIQKADIDSMAAWGFNAVRLPMHYALFTLPVQKEPVAGHNTWLPEGFRRVDSLLAWCSKAHIYLILDLHAAPGGQGNDLPISDRAPAWPSLWQSEANQDKTVALWEKLAERYKDAPYIGGYDLLNETNWGFTDSTDIRGTREQSNQPLWALLKRITRAIRQHDKHHMVILEGNGFANNYAGLDSLWDDNTVLSFHKYGNFNNLQSIQYFLDLREKLHAPIWLGESGENSNNWYTHCIKLMEDNQIGWSWWPWKKMGLNNPLEIRTPEHYGEFIQYARGQGPRPDPVSGKKILNELIQNIQIDQNIIHRDVLHAMFQSVQKPAALPFATYFLGPKPCYILAADYDFGGNGYGYFDKDTARYPYTPGVHTDGNKGYQYRNDGVDIRIDTTTGKPYVFSIEDGEWLSYSLQIPEAGKYQLQLDYAPDVPSDTVVKSAVVNILQGTAKLGQIRLDISKEAQRMTKSDNQSGTPLFRLSHPLSVRLAARPKPVPIRLIFRQSDLLLRGILVKETMP